MISISKSNVESLQLKKGSDPPGKGASTASLTDAPQSHENNRDSGGCNYSHDGSRPENTSKAASDRSSPPVTPQREHIATSELQKAKRVKNKIKERRIRRLMNFEETFNSRPKFPRFFVMKFPGVEIDTKLNVIAVDKEIKDEIGEPKKISKLNRNSLLIEVQSENQGEKLSRITNVHSNPVIVEIHKTMNNTKGTVFSETMSQSTEEEILEQLKDQGVTKVERMKRMVEGVLTPTNRYILTFESTYLPPMIKLADWHRELVELYIPAPLRCLICQRLGHTKKWCTHKEDSCGNCCRTGHKIKECPNDSYCINCRGDHRPNDRQCEAYLRKAEILATQVREKVPYNEAAERVRERYIEEGRSFSNAVRNPGESERKTEANVTQTYIRDISNIKAQAIKQTGGLVSADEEKRKRDADREMMLEAASKENKVIMDATQSVTSIDISVSTMSQTMPDQRNQSKNEHKNSKDSSKRRSSLENESGGRRETSGESEYHSKHKKVIENKDSEVKDTEKVNKDRDYKVKDAAKSIVGEKTEHDQAVYLGGGGKSKLVDYKSSEENLTGKNKEQPNRKRERAEQQKPHSNKKPNVTENDKDRNQQYIPVLGALGTRVPHKGSGQGSGGSGARKY